MDLNTKAEQAVDKYLSTGTYFKSNPELTEHYRIAFLAGVKWLARIVSDKLDEIE